MKRDICIFVFLFFCRFAAAQIPDIIPNPVSIARIAVADTRSWTAFNNPAMLAYVEKIELKTAFDNRFLLKELSTKSIQAGFHTKPINIGVSFSYYGYQLFHEMLAGVDFARNFGDKFSLGIGFDYYTVFFQADNEYRGALLGRLGLSAKLAPSFALGFSTFNPFQNHVKTDFVTKRVPSVFSLGTEYFFTDDFVWRTQIDKEISSNYRFATGFEYCILDFLTAKLGGYALEYFVPCLGFGLVLKDYAANLNCELNPVLGLCTMITLGYKFK